MHDKRSVGNGPLKSLPTGPGAEQEKQHKDPKRETAGPVLFASPAGTSHHEFCIAVQNHCKSTNISKTFNLSHQTLEISSIQ